MGLTPFRQEILGKFTARQLRLAFLTQLWNAKIDFSESLMTGEVRNIEATVNVSYFCVIGSQYGRSDLTWGTELLHCRQSPHQSEAVGSSYLHGKARLRCTRTEAVRQVSGRELSLSVIQPGTEARMRLRTAWKRRRRTSERRSVTHSTPLLR